MQNILDYRLFRIGQTQVTLASLLATVAILALTWLAARLLRKLVAEKLFSKAHVDPGIRYAIGRVISYLVWVLGLIVALQPLGINATTLAVFGGAIGVGIGFGLQDIAKNFIAGLILLVERPIKVGDRIEIGKVIGDVAEIRARATLVRTNDDIYLIVPNARFITDTVTNWSYRTPRVRFHFPVGVAYGSDPHAVEKALIDAAGKSEHVLKEPAPSVIFVAFGESSLDFELACWTAVMLHRRSALRSEINFNIHEVLGERGIEFPSPQRDLHIRSAEGLERLWPSKEVSGSRGSAVKPTED
ncbi:MAG TPA: mechanosensitive ion channel domain-containing protein [Thermoanaerobaculia bacterium]|nr:mechanosensitive ion channel domain-containing protein [Thermoanaerobaculia bacterium]